MRQHAIPQNVLDVEFKLFTKFTVREFVYMAVGIGFGGIFLLLFTRNQMPGIIAIPVFLISSGIGLFLGLVPLNDQQADTYIKNYLLAITRPTQRVWKNDLFDRKFEVLSEKQKSNPKTKIIGSSNFSMSSPQFEDNSAVSKLDNEEALKLQSLAQAASSITFQTSGNLPQPNFSQPQTQQSNAPVQNYVNPIQQTNQQPSITVTSTANTQVSSPAATLPTSNNQSNPAQTAVLTGQNGKTTIIVNSQNIQNYQVMLNIPENLRNFIFTVITDKAGLPISKCVTMLKDKQGKLIQAKLSNDTGVVIFDKQLNPDEYVVEVSNQQYNFPDFRILIDQLPFPPIKISAL